MKLIKVNDETHEKLLRLAGKLQAKFGKRMTMDKVIKHLIEEGD